MGARRVADDGNSADRCAWIVLRNFTTGLRVRLSAGGNCLLDRVSVLRLAGSVCRGRTSGVSGALYPGACAGITGLVAPTTPGFLERRADCAQTSLAALSVCHSVNDSLQRDVAWNPGHVS